MMYHYWNKFGMRPSVFYNMPLGEKIVIRAFFENEIKEGADNYKGCPFLEN